MLLQARGGQETEEVRELLSMARVFGQLDWRTTAVASYNDAIHAWQLLYEQGKVPNISHVVPQDAGGSSANEQTGANTSAAGTPTVLYAGCANAGCSNLSGLGERCVRTLWCGGCMRVRYCSKKCQREDNAWHRSACER